MRQFAGRLWAGLEYLGRLFRGVPPAPPATAATTFAALPLPRRWVAEPAGRTWQGLPLPRTWRAT